MYFFNHVKNQMQPRRKRVQRLVEDGIDTDGAEYDDCVIVLSNRVPVFACRQNQFALYQSAIYAIRPPFSGFKL
jgi:hypothetical protein